MPTQLVGILNLTPDSFSDGGQHADVNSMHTAIAAMHLAGAAVVDVGAESTRPGATPLDAPAEWERLQNFAEAVMPECVKQRMSVSIDTRHAATATNMLARGAAWVNDVSGFIDPAMVEAVRAQECRLVVMHSLSVPADPAKTVPEGEDIIAYLLAFARARFEQLERVGIARQRLIFDPGIGFGKTAEQCWQIIQRIAELKVLGVPLLVGHSRKSFLTHSSAGWQLGRDEGTLVVSAYLIQAGVEFLRVHDVAAHAALVRKS